MNAGPVFFTTVRLVPRERPFKKPLRVPESELGFPSDCADELHQMPLQEKLFVMEALWDDLSSNENDVDVPQWHKSILD